MNNGQQQQPHHPQAQAMLSVPGATTAARRGEIRVPQARRSSAVAIVLTRGESINLQQSAAARAAGKRRRRRRTISTAAGERLRIVRSKYNPWDSVLGDCSLVDDILDEKRVKSVRWAPAHFANTFLRAVGQPLFINNPLLGALLLISFFVHDASAGLGALMGGGIAVAANYLLDLHPKSHLRNGVSGLNGCLLGVAGIAAYPRFYPGSERPSGLWGFLAVGALASSYLSKSLQRFLGRFGLPYLTLPFNIIVTCAYLPLRPGAGDHSDNLAAEAGVAFDWLQAARGMILSVSQVWGIDDVASAGVAAAALLLFSPLMALICAVGAAVGTIMGFFLLPSSSWPALYSGLWSHNPMLSAAALACVFYPLTAQSALLAAVGAAATFCVQFAVFAVFQDQVPVFLWPSALVCVALLLVSTEGERGALRRVEEMSYPEKQTYCWHRRRKLGLRKVSQSVVDTEDRADEAENDADNEDEDDGDGDDDDGCDNSQLLQEVIRHSQEHQINVIGSSDVEQEGDEEKEEEKEEKEDEGKAEEGEEHKKD